jgi:uncharacterized protein
MSGLRIDVADLLAHPGTRREVRVSAPLDGLAGSAAQVTAPVEVSVTLERISDGIVVRGDVRTTWQGECSYCLTALDEPLSLHVDELFERDPVEGETYPIEGHEIDLEQMARDAVLLELPLAPHCAAPCVADTDDAASDPAGADPAGTSESGASESDTSESGTSESGDPRWAVLSELEIQ